MYAHVHVRYGQSSQPNTEFGETQPNGHSELTILEALSLKCGGGGANRSVPISAIV